MSQFSGGQVRWRLKGVAQFYAQVVVGDEFPDCSTPGIQSDLIDPNAAPSAELVLIQEEVNGEG